MALSLPRWPRRRRIEPMPQPDFPVAALRDRPGATTTLREDDYLVEGEEQVTRPSAVAQVMQMLQVVLIVVIAILSLSIFWLIGVLLNLF